MAIALLNDVTKPQRAWHVLSFLWTLKLCLYDVAGQKTKSSWSEKKDKDMLYNLLVIIIC